MSVLDAEIYESHDRDDGRSRIAEFLARWPVLPCLFITLMFMLATNDPGATTNWQEVSREHVHEMSINLDKGREARQIGFILLGLWGAAMLFVPARRMRVTPIFVFPMAVFIGWSYLSILWSPDPSFTAKRLVVFTCCVLGVLGFVKRYRLRDLALLAFVGGLLQNVANVVFDILYTPTKLGMAGYRFSGLQHPNHAGISAVLLVFGSLYFFDRTRMRRFLVPLAIAVVILLLSKSRSALFGGIAGGVTFSLLRWQFRTVALVGCAIALFTGMLLLAAASGVMPEDWTNIIHMGRADAQSTALTGRPQIWSAALEVFGSDYARLLTGMGYESFWTPETADFVSGRVWFRISEGHDGYFDLLLALGVIGVGCFAFLLYGCLGRWCVLAWRERDVTRGGTFAFAAMILAFTAIHCLTESTMVDPNFCTYILCASLAFLTLRGPKPLEAA